MSRTGDPNAKIKLLGAAEAEFVQHGLHDAKIERITARAGLSKGAFYLHFASKEDAFEQLVETLVARLHQFIQVIECAPESGEGAIPWGDAEAYLEMWLGKDTEIFEFIWQNRGLMALLFRGGSSVQYRHLVEAFADRAAAATRASLVNGQRHGMYPESLDVDVASQFIAGAYDRIARHVCQLPRRPDFPKLLRQLQAFVIGGIGGDLLREHTDQRVSEPRAAPPPEAPRIKRGRGAGGARG